MILFEKFSAVFAFAEVDLSLTRVDFGILSYVIDSALKNGPAVILCVVLGDFLKRVVNAIWVLN